ncbi:MAG: UDP-N-acetylmuramate:L-alanyl-gamma-D-glutamyl-meso-diaminopimelate ligase [Pseudomonadota bacterium]|nr:UDP-N-acetylmuramate:L-alanyl-gamma-D-glutamyl-meso-diaminopimelate ligase [Pseudomonadota bacterium]
MAHVHILGVCGTFMAGIALIAREAGHRVTGSDANVYPPMSTLLAEQGITISPGDDLAQLDPAPDIVVIGNALSRGHPVVEAVLERGLRYTSGPQWLSEAILQSRWVLAVAGTHGKTTTSSVLAWMLEHAGMQPGFLIGGVPGNFPVSARLGGSDFFVIEADEYDTAFFDKRSKFVHYRPRTAVLNNLEFDHADIFDDLAAIERQFHHLVRTVPGSGAVIRPAGDVPLERVIERGCWSQQIHLGTDCGWQIRAQVPDWSQFELVDPDGRIAEVRWSMLGAHNARNAMAAAAAARHVGVPVDQAAAALRSFEGVRRRLETRGRVGRVTVYDDFAHHPTAITETLRALRARVGSERIVAILEPRSNTMKQGHHREALATSLSAADVVHVLEPAQMGWSLAQTLASLGDRLHVHAAVTEIVDTVVSTLDRDRPQHLLVMSNGGFGGIHERLLRRLEGA